MRKSDERWLTMEEVCTRFRMTKRELRRNVRRGLFPRPLEKSPRKWLFDAAVIREWEERGKPAADEPPAATGGNPNRLPPSARRTLRAPADSTQERGCR